MMCLFVPNGSGSICVIVAWHSKSDAISCSRFALVISTCVIITLHRIEMGTSNKCIMHYDEILNFDQTKDESLY